MIFSFAATTAPLYLARPPSARRFIAKLLRTASRALAKASRAMEVAEARRTPSPAVGVLEFYAEAGAPEGALYVDGKLLGYLPGVNRL